MAQTMEFKYFSIDFIPATPQKKKLGKKNAPARPRQFLGWSNFVFGGRGVTIKFIETYDFKMVWAMKRSESNEHLGQPLLATPYVRHTIIMVYSQIVKTKLNKTSKVEISIPSLQKL